MQIYKSEKFLKSHVVLEGIGEWGGGSHLKVTQTGTLVRLWSRVRPLVARRPPERSAILARWD